MPPRSPLPPRHGLQAAWVRTPDRGKESPEWETLSDFLFFKISQQAPTARMLADGRFVLTDGTPINGHEPYQPHTFIWFHRDRRDEAEVPFEIEVLYADERIVVVDKPHFLATIPRGNHVLQSVVVRVRNELGYPDASPAHRLDRLTAGVLVLTTEKKWRGAYQEAFRHRQIDKHYEALAPVSDLLEFPQTVRNHIVKERGNLQAVVYPDREPNSETLIELAERHGGTGRYKLTPLTGRTHQLRVHLNGLGIPIVGDPLYPIVQDVDLDDFSTPLQLVARELTFTDPVDASRRCFTSNHPLDWAPQ
ncbi:pseudouridine synthase [Brooklawnia sp.]|uniref:pseudouridine synthase n=1 Tax=Brooklawnia sp. TaxID=2699740 RepID=UPI00311EF853